jgi:hypothetical protein
MGYNRGMQKYKTLLSFILGIIIGSSLMYANQSQAPTLPTDVHVHSDFLMVINGESADLTGSEYQSGIEQVLHKHSHLHDGNDDVLHRHAEGITLTEFLSSLGFTLTNTCLSTDTGEAFCSNQTSSLHLFVNETEISPITIYIPQEEDKILLFYGADEPSSYFADITADACIYSLTCPERGTPPPESCGITCEL